MNAKEKKGKLARLNELLKRIQERKAALPTFCWFDIKEDGEHFYHLYANPYYVCSMSMNRCSVSGEIG